MQEAWVPALVRELGSCMAKKMRHRDRLRCLRQVPPSFQKWKLLPGVLENPLTASSLVLGVVFSLSWVRARKLSTWYLSQRCLSTGRYCAFLEIKDGNSHQCWPVSSWHVELDQQLNKLSPLLGWSPAEQGSNLLQSLCHCLGLPGAWMNKTIQQHLLASDRRWDGWMASLTPWTWVWASSGSWWWTGKPGMLRFMGSQRVWHHWATELNYKLTVKNPPAM